MSTVGHPDASARTDSSRSIIDLTPEGPARLLDMVAGRSAATLATWLADQPAGFAQALEVIAMDGFAGYKTAPASVVPDAVTVMEVRRGGAGSAVGSGSGCGIRGCFCGVLRGGR